MRDLLGLDFVSKYDISHKFMRVAYSYVLSYNYYMSMQTITASDARTNLYELIARAGQGISGYEITLRGKDPVVMISRSEYESWQETLDLLVCTDELSELRQARKETATLTHEQMLRQIAQTQDQPDV